MRFDLFNDGWDAEDVDRLMKALPCQVRCQKRDVFDMVKMAVGNQDIANPALFGEAEYRGHGSSVQKQPSVYPKAAKSVSGKFAPITTQDSDLHQDFFPPGFLSTPSPNRPDKNPNPPPTKKSNF
jgi:hypothetical protein